MPLEMMQLAFNTNDMPATLAMYATMFGFQNAGAQVCAGDVIRIQDLPGDGRTLIWWMVGAQQRFQLEFFHHTKPAQRPLRPDWTVADHGWTRFGIAVADFEATLLAMRQGGVESIAGVHRVEGLRRAAFRDPHTGAMVDVMEDGAAIWPHGRRRATPGIVYASASVSDLEAALKYYGEVVELPAAQVAALHPAGADAIWGLPDAAFESRLLDAGGMTVELVRYANPVGRPRPADYRVSDQGFVNVGFGAETPGPVTAALDRAEAFGCPSPYVIRGDEVVAGYINHPEREIELLNVPPALYAMLGFTPGWPLLV